MNIQELKELLEGKSIVDVLKTLTTLYEGQTLFTTSFGIEDQVITHLIFSNNIPVETVTIDTGRLFPETYDVFNKTVKKYQQNIKVYFPDRELVEAMVSEKGPYSFYYSTENRHECCRIRKVVPLNRALQGKMVWISGIRAEQSGSRKNLDWLEYDQDKKLFKYYPLLKWSFEEVKKFVRDNKVPYNVLHDRNFISIGCQPCTRAVNPGDDFRSGRWWWENDNLKECGLHIK
ncbi:MAG TPA: phosphoadenylyl-sulfate reductase [Bacteroidales bacterium]|nr:phosphoadenylyl-sulfate reductase [Bacteroidales bacterium]HPI69415.1 phosphoadenylyl-sulfate reductase [Bacteroidales bacterium]HPR13379.1 phosphoadenylyl-sulfate reductase [Bacteroidales bacterium]HRW85144.1 phosphoadenylyl-sulfate reductase [Bacteroidales bacterium]